MSNPPADGFDADVLVVGAGPVGLATAIELGRRGVRVHVVEAGARAGNAPRAKTTNVRTCEHLRRWGLIDAFRAQAPFGVDYPSTVCFATRLKGRAIASFDNAFHCRPGHDPLYAEHAQWIPQYRLEEVLRQGAQALPSVRFSFDTEFQSLRSEAEGVVAQLQGPAGAHTLRARYLVGADGARSTVRQQLGIRMQGSGGLSRNRMIVFRQPGLRDMHALPDAVMYWLVNGEAPAVMGPLDTGDRWYIGGSISPLTEDPVQFIRRATGLDIAPEILAIDDWDAHQLLAERYRAGRFFLAGDACHLHPPYGGHGMNLGIGDAVDLGWKLAARLQGWGGETLLESYESERGPVHQRTIAEAVHNHATRTGDLYVQGIEAEGPAGDAVRELVAGRVREAKAREFHSLGVVLGYRYTGSPVIAHEDESADDISDGTYVPSARPGCRAPHAWLRAADGTERSLYDLFGPGYTLLALAGEDDAGIARLREAARELGCPLTVAAPGHPALRADYAADYVLIRPDQHVAWRGERLPDDPIMLLRLISGRQHASAGLAPA